MIARALYSVAKVYWWLSGHFCVADSAQSDFYKVTMWILASSEWLPVELHVGITIFFVVVPNRDSPTILN